MLKSKSFDYKLSSVILFYLLTLGLYPLKAMAEEIPQDNAEILSNVSDQAITSDQEPLSKSLTLETSDTVADSLNSQKPIIPLEEIKPEKIDSGLIWSDVNLNSVAQTNPQDQVKIISTEPENIESEHPQSMVWQDYQVITSQSQGDSVSLHNPQTEQNKITVADLNEAKSAQNQEDFEFTPISLEEALQYTPETMAQVNNVNQLRDVSPQDWAYDALRNLVENYDCLEGYPNQTFRGDRPLTRYEFAAGLNACLESLNITQADVSQEEFAQLKRLVTEFEAEITTLGTRVDNLEGRVSFLEDHQFSTTTKLFGQVIFGIQGRNDNSFTSAFRFNDGDTQINTVTNTQLSLFTQFSPRSILLTGLQAGSGGSVINGPALGNFVRLGYEGNTNNSVQLSDLTYRHLITDNFSVIVGAAGVSTVNVFRGPNRVESAGFGPLSRFAQRNPIISVGAGGAGLGFDWQVSDRISMQGVYSTGSANNPTQGGLFGGDNGTTTLGVQLVASPLDNLDVSFQYVNAYSPFGFLGTFIGDDPVVLQGAGRAPINTDAFGGALDWRITPEITLGGWLGYTTSTLESAGGDVDTFNWMSYVTFPDLFAEGNLGAIFVGQPPKITESNLPVGRNVPDFLSNGNLFASQPGGQPGTSTHIEAFYRFKINDNISITPGVIIVLDPGHNSANETITIGAIRTTLTF